MDCRTDVNTVHEDHRHCGPAVGRRSLRTALRVPWKLYPTEGLAPYLSDMMEQEKKVSYKEVYAAVGRDALAGIFGNFFWGQRPNRRRGNMAKEKYKHDPK